LAPFAAAHDDLRALELDVLDAQTKGFEQTQSAAVKQGGDELMGVL
jgi:hypothetical protein